MTIQAHIDSRALWRDYEIAAEDVRAATDAAMTAALDAIKAAGFRVASDDRAAELEAVIFGFIRASNA